MVDFIAKLTQVDTSTAWIVEVDGSSYNAREGVGIRITTPDQRTYEHLIQL